MSVERVLASALWWVVLAMGSVVNPWLWASGMPWEVKVTRFLIVAFVLTVLQRLEHSLIKENR